MAEVRAIDDAVEKARQAARDPEVLHGFADPSLDSALDAMQDPSVDAVLESLPAAIAEAKAGYKTTEFWMALVSVFAAQVGALSLPGEHGTTIATVAIVVAYVLSRGVAKAGVPSIPST